VVLAVLPTVSVTNPTDRSSLRAVVVWGGGIGGVKERTALSLFLSFSLSLSLSLSHAHTHMHTRTHAPHIYAHRTHTGKVLVESSCKLLVVKYL
jgi:hypothetical protein